MQPAENQRQKENLDRSQVKKKLTYRVGKIKCILDFSSEAIQARRE